MARQSEFLYRQVSLIDTSAAIAFLDEREAHHKAAKVFFENPHNLTWVSVDVTAHEAFTRVRYGGDYLKAIKAFDFLRSMPVRHVTFELDDEKKALEILQKYSDHKLSFHDALCAAVMLRHGIYKIFTFDKDFLILGFQVLPSPQF